MPFIATIAPERAEGLLRRIYDAAIRRAGKVFAVVRVQSQQPRVLEASTELYVRVMHAKGEPLTRAQRELLAAYVSMINGCEY
jgi:alkylhydroperoxidase family enzyme